MLLDTLLGAEIHYVALRSERSVAMGALAERLAERGRRPFVIPLGASTSLGALGYAQAVGEFRQFVMRMQVNGAVKITGGNPTGRPTNRKRWGHCTWRPGRNSTT